jgi:FkbM family methyltransferase
MKSALRRLIGAAGYRINRTQDCDALYFLLETLLKKQQTVTVIQVGANDGVTSDPIHDFVVQHPTGVQGVVVEPVREYFERLERNYARFPAMKPMNVAIHRSERLMTMHRPRPKPGLPRWMNGIASFDPTHSSMGSLPASDIITETVECLTFAELLKASQLPRVDLLQIDTEGYDAEIIRGIDFNETRPRILRFEHGRLKTMPRPVFDEIRGLLHAAGYELMIEAFDCTAYQPSVVLDVPL